MNASNERSLHENSLHQEDGVDEIDEDAPPTPSEVLTQACSPYTTTAPSSVYNTPPHTRVHGGLARWIRENL